MEDIELYRGKNIKSLKVQAYIRQGEPEDDVSFCRVRDCSDDNFRLEISEPTVVIREIEEIMKSPPDSRPEKIEALKKKIEEGTYSRPSLKIAGKIINKSLLGHK